MIWKNVLDVIVRDGTTDYTVDKISRAEYLNTPVKSTTGRPTQFFFDGQINPVMYFYPAADQSYTIVYNALTRIQDAGAYTNTTDLPFRFYPCLVAGLAYYIAMKKAPERMADLKFEYEDVWKRAADTDGGRDSVFLTPQNYFSLMDQKTNWHLTNTTPAQRWHQVCQDILMNKNNAYLPPKMVAVWSGNSSEVFCRK